MTDLFPTWNPQWKPSRLCLRQKGSNRAVVVAVPIDVQLGQKYARLCEGWLNGRKISDPTEQYKIGETVQL